MATISGYITGAYVNPIEPTGGDAGNTYMRVGNNDSGIAYWVIIPLFSGFPSSGTLTSATLRLSEYNSDYRGAAGVTLKISPVTGAWNTSTKWNTVPAYNAGVVATYSNFPQIPSASFSDYATDYHPTQYKWSKYLWSNYPTTPPTWKFIDYVYWSTNPTSPQYSGVYKYVYISTIAAYYETYIKYHDIDIKTVAQYCIDHSVTGLLLYFDISGANDSRKYFKSPLNSNQNLQPLITLVTQDAPPEPGEPPPPSNPPIKIFTGSANKQALAVKVMTGSAFKTAASMKIATAQGSTFKTIF